jgi:hypothetical protein
MGDKLNLHVGVSLVESKVAHNNEANSTSDKQKEKDNVLAFVVFFYLRFWCWMPYFMINKC